MKKLSISLLLLAIMILSISVVSATDADVSADLATTHDDDSTVQAVDEVDEPLSTNDEGDAKLGDSYKTFTDLRNVINMTLLLILLLKMLSDMKMVFS